MIATGNEACQPVFTCSELTIKTPEHEDNSFEQEFADLARKLV